ncbi:kinesin-like protein KIF20B [Trematomus bernacchii]|uniref:kinesin-like protein KIF20B n=1 Tax=Trematomus bernacchii TaxID=40690 RepID=UPI00146B5F2D|nr:kinesin-like protein KIF20B [Trematomus bernacchii]
MMESHLNTKAERRDQVKVDDLRIDLLSEFSALPYPQLSSTDEREHLKVYLRIRPFSSAESHNGESQDCVTIEPPDTALLKPPNLSLSARLSSEKSLPQTGQRFKFSQVYGPETSQKDFFQGTVKDLVKDVLEGGNSLVFTYGVTNAGKTFTFLGPDADAGILPRTLDVIFSSIAEQVFNGTSIKPQRCREFTSLTAEQQAEEAAFKRHFFRQFKENERSNASLQSSTNKSLFEGTSMMDTSEERINLEVDAHTKFSVWVSFCEIYNENIYDLLEAAPSGAVKRINLRLSQDVKGNSFVKDLRWVQVNTAEEAYKVMKLGKKNQSFSATQLNFRSSRSHSIFSIRILRIEDIGTMRVRAVSELCLCDLAGSERCAKTQNKGERLKEAGNINTSLLILGKCLKALRHNQQAKLLQQVPFRESKLTHYLQSFLCGRGKACMIVNINQCASMYDETLNVLKFSAVAQKVVVLSSRPPSIVPSSSSKKSAFEMSILINNADRKNRPGNRRSSLIGWESSLEDVQEDEDDEDEEDQSLMESTMDQTGDEEEVTQQLQVQLKKERAENLLMETRVRDEIGKEFSELFSEMQNDYNDRLSRDKEILEERAETRMKIFKNLIDKMADAGPGQDAKAMDVLAAFEEERRGREEAITALEIQTTGREEALASLQKERGDNEKLLESERRAKDKAAAELSEESKQRMEVVASLCRERRVRQEAEIRLEEERKEVRRLMEERETLQQEVREKTSRLETSEQQMEENRREEAEGRREMMAVAHEAIAQKDKELEKRGEEINRLKESTKQDSDEVKSLSVDLQRKEDDSSDLKEKLADYKKQIQQVQKEISTMREEEKLSKQKLTDMEKSKRQLQSDIASRDRTIQTLRVTDTLHQKSCTDLESTQRVMEDMRLALTEQEETQEQMETVLEEKLNVIQELSSEVEKLKGMLLQQDRRGNDANDQTTGQSDDLKQAIQEVAQSQERFKLCSEKHQSERRKWLDEKLLLIGQAKEAEGKRNQEMRKFAEDRERHARQQSQLESLSSQLAEKEQLMEKWRKERDTLVSALEVQLQKLLSSQVEKDKLIQQLQNNSTHTPAESAEGDGVVAELQAALSERDSEILRLKEELEAANNKQEETQTKTTESESPATLVGKPQSEGIKRKSRGRRDNGLSVSSQSSNGYPSVLDASEISTENGRMSRFPRPEMEISFSPLQPNRMALRRQGEENSVTVKITRSARKRKSVEMEKCHIFRRSKRRTTRKEEWRTRGTPRIKATPKLTAHKEEESSPADVHHSSSSPQSKMEGALQKFGDFLQSSPTLLGSKAKKMMSLVSGRSDFESASSSSSSLSLRLKKSKKKLYRPEISSPMDMPSYPIISRTPEEKESDHQIIKRRLRTRTPKL